jgi:hypothetical protein
MPKLTIEIECDNAAFDECAEHEAARILRLLMLTLSDEQPISAGSIPWARSLMDINGNRVGRARILR